MMLVNNSCGRGICRYKYKILSFLVSSTELRTLQCNTLQHDHYQSGGKGNFEMNVFPRISIRKIGSIFWKWVYEDFNLSNPNFAELLIHVFSRDQVVWQYLDMNLANFPNIQTGPFVFLDFFPPSSDNLWSSPNPNMPHNLKLYRFQRDAECNVFRAYNTSSQHNYGKWMIYFIIIYTVAFITFPCSYPIPLAVICGWTCLCVSWLLADTWVTFLLLSMNTEGKITSCT